MLPLLIYINAQLYQVHQSRKRYSENLLTSWGDTSPGPRPRSPSVAPRSRGISGTGRCRSRALTKPRGGVQLSKERCHEESILTSGVGDDDDVPLALLGGGQSHDLPIRLPLGDEQSVAAVDEDADQVLGQSEMSICRVASSGPITAHLRTRAEVLPADGDLGARRPLPRRDAAHYRGRAHGQLNIFLTQQIFFCKK